MRTFKVYYTFQDILDYVSGELGLPAPESPHDKNTSSTWFKTLLNDLDLVYYYNELDIGVGKITSAELEGFIQYLVDVVYERHHDDYLYYKYGEYDEELVDDDIKRALDRILDVIDLTLPKYIPLIKECKANSANPVRKLESHSNGKTRFNDTPQDGGDFNDDNHATNVSQSESDSYVDSGSVVQRLDEMYKGWRSIILDWSNDFNQLFLKEEQL